MHRESKAPPSFETLWQISQGEDVTIPEMFDVLEILYPDSKEAQNYINFQLNGRDVVREAINEQFVLGIYDTCEKAKDALGPQLEVKKDPLGYEARLKQVKAAQLVNV